VSSAEAARENGSRARKIMSAGKPTRAKATSLEFHEAQDQPHQRIGRARSIAEHTLALEFKFQIADQIRRDAAGWRNVPGTNQAAQQDGLPLVVHADLALRLHQWSSTGPATR
jgi:hypothetical protein